MGEKKKVVPFDTSEEQFFQPDIDFVKYAYLDRRDFINQVKNLEPVPDSQLEGEFNDWLEDIQAQAWLKGYVEHTKHAKTKLQEGL